MDHSGLANIQGKVERGRKMEVQRVLQEEIREKSELLRAFIIKQENEDMSERCYFQLTC